MLFGIFFVIIEAKQLDMKTILRNFFSVLRRFKTASVLNVLGLSIAFVAFMLIMMQVNYDYTFDRSHPNADAIFRVDIVHGSKGSQAIICRPFARAFTGSSPLIEEGCLLSAWTESRFFYIEDGGQRTSYKEDAWNVTPGVLEVFRFDMLEGSERSLDEPNSVVLPESMARKIFGDEIIGFIPDIKFASFRQEVTPMAFYLWGKYQWGQEGNYYNTAYVKFKAGSDLRSGMEHVRESLEKFDSEYPFVVRFYDEVLQHTYEKELKIGSLITLFSLVAIFISIVGVFGLVVFESEYKRKEIAVRKVLGSTTGEILYMFNVSYFWILLICFVFGAPVAWYGVHRWLENFAYRTPMYWWVLPLAFLAVGVITFMTVTYQNWHVANENPVKNIKSE